MALMEKVLAPGYPIWRAALSDQGPGHKGPGTIQMEEPMWQRRWFRCLSPPKKKKHKRITMKEYYAYKLQVRIHEGLHVHLAGRLYQQYVVDAFSCVEQARLWWLRTHQQNLRSDLYSSVSNKFVNGETTTSNIGKGFILPANFLGSKSAESKKELTSNIDKFVSAELPDPDYDPVGFAAVKSLIMHGPRGLQNPKSPCMNKMKCTKHFPKKYFYETYFDQSGFPIYRRRKTGFTISKGKCELDNGWVVHYKSDLLVKYQCHMNVEICCHARSLKYLFEYCLKGHDRATIEITSQRADKGRHDETPVDEINAYFDGRYICVSEAAYQIFGYPIHCRSISVLRLSFHLPRERICTFLESEVLAKVVRREKNKHSQLGAFLHLNINDPRARNYTYDQIPEHYIWNEIDGELWYLRLILSNIRGPTSFESLKTVNGIQYRTFKDACKVYGLLDDDNEWHLVLEQCAISGLPCQIRQLFVHIIVNCQVSDLTILWEKHWNNMVDDLIIQRKNIARNEHTAFSDRQLQYFALAEIDKLLRYIGKSLKQFKQLPQSPVDYLHTGTNILVIDETSYNLSEMEDEFNKLFPNCNPEQFQVFNDVVNSVQSKASGVFFIYGSGGYVKTFIWKTIIYKLRSLGLIVLPVASSGIAATLMPGRRTAHSRFKILIVIDDYFSCAIYYDSDIAEHIKHTSLIIYDEASMQYRYTFECLNRSLRDIMRAVDHRRYNMPFGGIAVVLGGDFRKILPMITLGSRGDIVSACITNSPLWKHSKILLLHRNMRLNQGQTEEEIEKLKRFVDWVLKVGNGQIPPPKDVFFDYEEDDIMIPPTYPDFLEKYRFSDYLSERAILTPTNQIVSHLNSLIVDTIPCIEITYYSVDRAEDFGGTAFELSFAFPPEYLNSISIPRLPPHELKLKEGVAVMLMRNLNQTLGLCNGTRMMVTRCLTQCMECEVIFSAFVGTKHFIPRMELQPTDTKLPFKLIRKQMPLQICYSMTINKSQGQSLQIVGLFLPNPVFTHGQFYVAVR
ncbi:uncharacterized protein LOC141695887 [Apium graveolens]|uniref:uncharacterized protein LOC141695887 n=1 Tax=Apium graveolens TaxID=4045 RepID=UPI003D7B9E69